MDLVHLDTWVSEPLGSTRWNLGTSWNWCIDKPLGSTRWKEHTFILIGSSLLISVSYVFVIALPSKAGDWPIAAPARPARCSPPGSRAVASSAAYGPLARACRSWGRYWLFQHFCLRRMLPGAARSVLLVIIKSFYRPYYSFMTHTA